MHRYLSRSTEIAADPAGQASRIVELSERQWTTRGLGPFAIRETRTDRFVGCGGLLWIEALQAVEINYMLDPTVWGCGYATEAAAAFLEIGFATHGLAKMVATTNPANEASARVLHKIGMRDAGVMDLGDNRIAALHEITRAQWLAMRDR